MKMPDAEDIIGIGVGVLALGFTAKILDRSLEDKRKRKEPYKIKI